MHLIKISKTLFTILHQLYLYHILIPLSMLFYKKKWGTCRTFPTQPKHFFELMPLTLTPHITIQYIYIIFLFLCQLFCWKKLKLRVASSKSNIDSRSNHKTTGLMISSQLVYTIFLIFVNKILKTQYKGVLGFRKE